MLKPHSVWRGATLLTTLTVAGLLLFVGLALSSTSVAQLHFVNSEIQSHRALAAAEAALAPGTEKLFSQSDYGSLRLSTEAFEVPVSGARGYLSFHPGTAAQWEVPISTSNREGKTPINGWGSTIVPPECIQLVAVGVAGEKRVTIEAVVELPEFPYALASAGPIQSSGGLTLGSLDTELYPQLAGSGAPSSSPGSSPTTLNNDDLLPAELFSNATGTAVELSGDVEIRGSLKAVGTVEIGQSVVVRGEVEQGASPEPIEDIDISTLLPPNSVPFVTGNSPVISGPQHFNGSELELHGGLTLASGLLYVNGDLTIHGGVEGRGAIIANGKVTILDGASLAGGNEVALVASDDVTVRGNGSDRSYFQGLIYTEGDLIADSVTLLGAFVANRESTSVDPGSRMTLRDSRVVHLGVNASQEIRWSGGGTEGWIKDSSDEDSRPPTAEEWALYHQGMAGMGDGARVGGIPNITMGRQAPLIPLVTNTSTEHGFLFDLNEFLSLNGHFRFISWRIL